MGLLWLRRQSGLSTNQRLVSFAPNFQSACQKVLELNTELLQISWKCVIVCEPVRLHHVSNGSAIAEFSVWAWEGVKSTLNDKWTVRQLKNEAVYHVLSVWSVGSCGSVGESPSQSEAWLFNSYSHVEVWLWQDWIPEYELDTANSQNQWPLTVAASDFSVWMMCEWVNVTSSVIVLWVVGKITIKYCVSTSP